MLMKPRSTTFIDVNSGNPIGDPIDELIVPTFPQMLVENHVGARYEVKTAELIDSTNSLRLIVNVKRLPT